MESGSFLGMVALGSPGFSWYSGTNLQFVGPSQAVERLEAAAICDLGKLEMSHQLRARAHYGSFGIVAVIHQRIRGTTDGTEKYFCAKL